MKLLVSLAMLLVFTFTEAQKLNFLENPDFASKRPVVFYTIASWCSENIEDFNIIRDTLMKYRDNYNLILLLDTVKTKSWDYTQIISSIKPNKIKILNSYFPKRLLTKTENKRFTSYVNDFFNLNLYRMGPGTLLIVKASAATPLLFDEREKMLSRELNIPHD